MRKAADAPGGLQVGDRYAQPQHLKGVPKEVILYQYEVCPFCCKVKAFLDYHKVVLACPPASTLLLVPQ